MKKLLISILLSVGIAVEVKAETAANLMGLGMPPALASALSENLGTHNEIRGAAGEAIELYPSASTTARFSFSNSAISYTPAASPLAFTGSTSDGADNAGITISGGGGAAVDGTRGGFIRLLGNESTNGRVDIGSGGAGGSIFLTSFGTGTIDFTTGATTKLQLENDGDLTTNGTNGGNIQVGRVGMGFRIAEGANAKMQCLALTAGSAVFSNTSTTASSRILCTSNSDGGTPGFIRVSSRSAGASFTVTSSNGADTSNICCVLFEPS